MERTVPPSVNAFQNPDFETGKLSPWFGCLDVPGKISTYHPYQGTYDAFSGNAGVKKPEVRYSGAVCQEIIVPKNPYLSVHIWPVSNDFTKGFGQTIAAYNATTGKLIGVLWGEDKESTSWLLLHKSLKTQLGTYVGDKIIVTFGVSAPGNKNKFIGLWIDNVSMTSQ